jgi:hypothetical protein
MVVGQQVPKGRDYKVDLLIPPGKKVIYKSASARTRHNLKEVNDVRVEFLMIKITINSTPSSCIRQGEVNL